MNQMLSEWAPKILSLLRIVIGFLFLWHGSQKLFNVPPMPAGVMPEGPLPTIVIVAGVLEFVGGILFLLGFFTRIVAFLLSGMMAVAYFGFHASGGLLPIVNNGEPAVMYCWIFFYFVFAGGGVWSIDYFLKHRRREFSNR